MSKPQKNNLAIPQYEPHYGKEEVTGVTRYLASGSWLTEFKETRHFEEGIRRFTGARYCSVVSNGTMALFLALKALDIGPGDEVIVPDITISATASAVILAGATPVFVDIEKESLCISVKEVVRALTKRTKAVIHVSLNGRAGELGALLQLCRERGIDLIEDAAQSLGSYYRGKHLGTHGTLGIFSFSMPKIVTTGQGGAVVTSSRRFFEAIVRMKDFGRAQSGTDLYETVGWNFKFTDLQAVFGVAQLKKIESNSRKKKRLFQLYQRYLSGVEPVLLPTTTLKDTAPLFIDILAKDRDGLASYLSARGIGTRNIYPALHTQRAFRPSVARTQGRCPVAQRVAREGLWLPSSLTLKDRDVQLVCAEVRRFYRR